jgi:hypothetical protein
VRNATVALIAESTPWIDAELARHGIPRTGTLEEPPVRTWATVIDGPTTSVRAWFKAALPVTAHRSGHSGEVDAVHRVTQTRLRFLE